MSTEYPRISAYSIIGDRQYQQDLCAYERQGGTLFAVLCDGMGGIEGGEQAARAGVSTMMTLFRENPPDGIARAGEWLRSALQAADTSVASLRNAEGNPLGGGSTAIAVLIDGLNYQWGCVGDSRIYLFRAGRLITLTRMHNYQMQLTHLKEKGEITHEEYTQESSKGEALISFLGIGGLSLVDVPPSPQTLLRDDILVMCSDGLYKSLDDQQILAILEEAGGSTKLMARRLTDTALRLSPGKQDNTTVMVIRCM